MNQVWDTPCDTHTEKLVLLALADNSNDQRICWPSITNLCKRCDLSRQGVISQIDKLTDRKLLSVRKSDGKVNVYELFPDQSTPLTGPIRAPVHTVDCHQSTRLTGPVHAIDTNHKEPSIEPPIAANAANGSSERRKKGFQKSKLRDDLISRWMLAHQEHFHREYQLSGPDRGAVKSFIESPTLTNAQIVGVAIEIWKNGITGYWCSKLKSLSILCNHLSEIQGEMDDFTARSPSAQRKSGVEYWPDDSGPVVITPKPKGKSGVESY